MRSQNYDYIVTYLKQAVKAGYKKRHPALRLLKKIITISSKPQYQPGFLKYSGEDNEARKLFQSYSIKPVPGISETTWCTFVAWEILDQMGYDTQPLLDKVYKKIGYTTAKEMYENGTSSDMVLVIDWKEAVKKANAGIPILVAALGIGNNNCHAGIVSPAFLDMHTVTLDQIIIGQGGYYNGFGTFGNFFSKQYVEKPLFFELKKK